MARDIVLTEADKARFWDKVDRSGGPDACWNWTACRCGKYGSFANYSGIGNRTGAHRIAYTLANGPIPPGLYVLHSCDNPGCVNPKHLWIGSPADNMADMVAKGRQATGLRSGKHTHPESRAFGIRNGAYTKPECVLRGEKNGSSKLCEADVIEIRRLRTNGTSSTEIARSGHTFDRNTA